MKNNLILTLSALLITGIASGYDRIYIQNPSVYNPYGYCCPNRYIINNPSYYPYWVQRTVNFVNAPTTKPRRYQRVRRLERLQKNYNQLSWLGRNNGGLTGYSVPVTKDIYKQMGITPFDPNSKVRTNSPACNQDLFSAPSGDEMIYNNGERYTDLKGASGKAGVTIIYD